MARRMVNLHGNSGKLHRISTGIEVRGLQGAGSEGFRQSQIPSMEPNGAPCGPLQLLHAAHVVKMTMGQGNGCQMQIGPAELLCNARSLCAGIDGQALLPSRYTR